MSSMMRAWEGTFLPCVPSRVKSFNQLSSGFSRILTLPCCATQGREFTWLRPNEVVTRAAAAGGSSGLDYLWLRSRTIVKISPEAERCIARCAFVKCCIH